MKKVEEVIKKIKNKFLDELFPEHYSCYNCSKEVNNENNYHLCNECIKKIKAIKYPCKICGDELNSFTKYCENCKSHKRHFDYVRSVTTYDGVARNLVHKLKYGNCNYIAKLIARYLNEEFVKGSYDLIDLIICVPITHEKLKTRGYNQTEEILKEFVKITDIDYNLDCIKRIKNNSTQTVLTRKERLENMKNSFEFTNSIDITNKNILVIDDVITTGSTLDEIARTLKENGAKKVFGLTFCHTKSNKSIYDN